MRPEYDSVEYLMYTKKSQWPDDESEPFFFAFSLVTIIVALSVRDQQIFLVYFSINEID